MVALGGGGDGGGKQRVEGNTSLSELSGKKKLIFRREPFWAFRKAARI